MKIDALSNGGAYQPQPQAVKHQGTESAQTVKQQQKPDLAKQNEIAHAEAQMAAERRSQENEHEVIQAIEKANNHIKIYGRRLEFSIHDSTKQIMVKVIDTDDDSVIREIPSEKVLDMVGHMWEMAGILVDERR